MTRRSARLILGALLPVLLVAGVARASLPGGRVRAFGSPSFPPYTFVTERGAPGGFLVELLQAALPADALTVELGDWQQVSERRHRAEIDLLLGPSFSRASATMLEYGEFLVDTSKPGFSVEGFLSSFTRSTSGKDLQRYCFFLPVVETRFAFFTRKGLPRDRTLKETLRRTVVVRRNSEGHFYLRERGLAGDVLLTDSGAEALYMLRSGEADYTLMGISQGRYLAGLLNLPDIVPAEEPLFARQQGMVVLHGKVPLTAELLERLRAFRERGGLRRLSAKWLPGRSAGLLDSPLVRRALMGIAAVGAVLLLWFVSLKKRVDVIVRQRERIMDFTKDGIVAIDRRGRISLLNRTAAELAGLSGDEKGRHIDGCIPQLGLSGVLESGERISDCEQNLNGRLVVTNMAPVRIKEEIIGAIATFRDTTEIRAMAREITGVRMYVESLRVQNHEFLNKLQAIAGLIQMGRADKAVAFISAEQQEWQSTTSFVSEHIENFVVGGILVGKIGKCRELGIAFRIDPDSSCGEKTAVGDQTLVMVIGNLLENAIEALREQREREPAIDFAIFDESNRIMISVADNGPGIPGELLERVFEKGFSTKQCGRACGYGLYSVRTMVEALEGDIAVDSVPGAYTEFLVTLPNGGA
ncbi:MAG: transporter substrate-binding domain-containing protein [Synergistales bacterium]|nr:transporter substrate-binding domain-containing protein [Synergistales bacterium]